jgi:protein gp37
VPGHPYEQGFDLRLVTEKLAEPLRWKTPTMVFVNSMSDLFHKDIPDDSSRGFNCTPRQHAERKNNTRCKTTTSMADDSTDCEGF